MKLKFIRKLFFLLDVPIVLFVIIFIFFSGSVKADGFVMQPKPFSDRWDYSNEDNQQAFIKHDQGTQKMIISIGLSEVKKKGAVWLFPVPSRPDKVDIDVVSQLPIIGGEEISKRAKSRLDEISKYLYASQFNFYLFLNKRFSSSVESFGSYSGLQGKGFEVGVDDDVYVHQHLQKNGITSEVITSKNARALYEYLKNKGLNVKDKSLPVLEDNYIGKEYSFVVSWVNSGSGKNNKSNNQRGVFVSFPTEKIYYPLLPTSVYGEQKVPATIRVFGHTDPEMFKDIEPYSEVKYYDNNRYKKNSKPEIFYNNSSQNEKYTKITINAPSKKFTQDLWINTNTPAGVYLPLFIGNYPVVSFMILFLLITIISGLVAGLAFFKELRDNPKKILLLSLSNCFTIWGLIIATILVKTKSVKDKNKDEKLSKLFAQIIQKGYFPKKMLSMFLFIVFIPVLFFGFWVAFEGLVITISTEPWTDLFRLIPVFGVPALLFFLTWFFAKIKKEDEAIFKKLRSFGYSSWFLQPRDKMKIVFILSFWILFVVLSWLSVELLKIVV